MTEDVKQIYSYMLSRKLTPDREKRKLFYAKEYMRMYMIDEKRG